MAIQTSCGGYGENYNFECKCSLDENRIANCNVLSVTVASNVRAENPIGGADKDGTSSFYFNTSSFYFIHCHTYIAYWYVRRSSNITAHKRMEGRICAAVQVGVVALVNDTRTTREFSLSFT